MDFNVLSPLVEELFALLYGARVERVYQGSGNGLYFILSRDRKKYILLLSADRALPRLHLVSKKSPLVEPAHPFVLYLRSHLAGTRIIRSSLLNRDRIVEIRFARQGDEYILVFELFGSAANILFLDPSFKILSVYYPVPPSEQVVRPLLPGLQYVLPGKNIARDSGAVSRAPVEGGAMSPNKAAELYYTNLLDHKQVHALRHELLTSLKKTLEKTERLKRALSVELQAAGRIEEYKQAGELILANMSILKTGMDQAELTGYDGKVTAVLLDTKSTPAQNAQRYFKKYKKAKAGQEIIQTRLQQAQDEADDVRALLVSLEKSTDIDELIDMRSGLASRGYLKQKTGEKRQARPGASSLPFKKVMFDRWEILIGKNAAGNDYVTTRISRPDDLWLHAEGLPGSHVLVKNPEGRDIPPAVLWKAAALAAYYSKGKGSGKVSVTYTSARHVRKPKGAKAGLVHLTERKSIMVKPEDG